MRENKGTKINDICETYTVIDIETTGFDPAHDSIIEVGAIKVKDGIVCDTYSSLINSGITIPEHIAELTGITNDMVIDAPDLRSVMTEFRQFIGDDVLLGHNISFDINFLYDNFMCCFNAPLSNDYIDTLYISRKMYPSAPNHRLKTLIDFCKIEQSTFHRALSDCDSTHRLYCAMKENFGKPSPAEQDILDSFQVLANPFSGKRIVVKGTPRRYSYAFMKALAEKCGAKLSNVFYPSCSFAIFAGVLQDRYQNGGEGAHFGHAEEMKQQGLLDVLVEDEFYALLGVPLPPKTASSGNRTKLSAKDIVAETDIFDDTHPFFGKVFVFTGTLEKMLRKDAMQIVVNHGGLCGDGVTSKTNFLVLGNNDYCTQIKGGKSTKQKKAEALKLSGSDIEIISENVFYDMIDSE